MFFATVPNHPDRDHVVWVATQAVDEALGELNRQTGDTLDRQLLREARGQGMVVAESWASRRRPPGNDEPLLVVCGACADAEGRMLVHRRRADAEENAGLWEFPGGKVELHEFPAAALVREWQEELGVTPVVGPLLVTMFTPPHPASGRTYRIDCYRVELDAEQRAAARPLAGDALAWVDAEQARQLPGCPAYPTTREALIAHLQ